MLDLCLLTLFLVLSTISSEVFPVFPVLRFLLGVILACYVFFLVLGVLVSLGILFMPLR